MSEQAPTNTLRGYPELHWGEHREQKTAEKRWEVSTLAGTNSPVPQAFSILVTSSASLCVLSCRVLSVGGGRRYSPCRYLSPGVGFHECRRKPSSLLTPRSAAMLTMLQEQLRSHYNGCYTATHEETWCLAINKDTRERTGTRWQGTKDRESPKAPQGGESLFQLVCQLCYCHSTIPCQTLDRVSCGTYLR